MREYRSMNSLRMVQCNHGGYVVGGLYRISDIDDDLDETDVWIYCDVHGGKYAMVNLRTGVSYNSVDDGDDGELEYFEFFRVFGSLTISSHGESPCGVRNV